MKTVLNATFYICATRAIVHLLLALVSCFHVCLFVFIMDPLTVAGLLSYFATVPTTYLCNHFDYIAYS